MKDEKPLPSERAAAKLGAAKRRLEKALHVRALTEARILKWGKRVKVLEKRLATDHYKEMDEKAREARVADAMKVAMGIKKGMAVGRKVDSTGQIAKPILRSSVCINGYHGLCHGRMDIHKRCHCQCHNTKEKGATG